MKKSNKIINIILSLFIIIQPILELVYLENSYIFNIKLSTFIRLLIFSILLLFLILKKRELKYKKYFIAYLIIVFIYFFLHHINALNFNSFNENNFNYNIFEEISYILRMLIPIFLIYLILNINYEEKRLTRTCIITISIISLTILISNIFKFSFSSYGYGIIKGNIIDWFYKIGEYNYLDLASRGLFNTVIIFYLIILLIPYIIYKYYICENKKLNIMYMLLIIISLLGAFIVGTKATTYGFIIILIVILILNLFFATLKKDYKFKIKKNIFIFACIIFSFLIIPYSPMNNRNNIDSSIASDKKIIEKENRKLISTTYYSFIENYLTEEEKTLLKDKKEINIKYLLKLIKNEEQKKAMLIDIIGLHYSYYGLTDKFIVTSYPYTIDPYFWNQFVNETKLEERSNNRMVVQKIYNRIIDINNNKYDKLFGITFSRISKVFPLERDFIYQYYSLGIIGLILLLGPYLFVVFITIFKMFKDIKGKLTYNNCSLLLGIGLVLCLAFYSGNTMENLSITIPMGILCGYILKKILD